MCEIGEVCGAGVALVAVRERSEREARHNAVRRQRFTWPGEELVMWLHRRGALGRCSSTMQCERKALSGGTATAHRIG